MENAANEDNTLPPVPDSTDGGDRAAWRKQWVAWRQALPAAIHAAWSAKLVAHLQDWLAARDLPGTQTIAFCWPIQNEPDVLPLIRRWQAQGVRVALPVVVAPRQPLVFRIWPAGGELAPDQYGIPTPLQGDTVQPDVLLLPGNAFDQRGYRLGYGGGFFDRTLAALNPRPLVIGLGFAAAIVPDLNPAAHDWPVDVLITEKSLNALR